MGLTPLLLYTLYAERIAAVNTHAYVHKFVEICNLPATLCQTPH